VNKKTDSLFNSHKKQYTRAILIVNKALAKDPDLFYGWQANIAMAFHDEFSNFRTVSKSGRPNLKEIHSIANNAAINFLNLLIKEK